MARPGDSVRGFWWLRQRQRDREKRAMARLAVHAKRAAVRHNQLLADVQPQPQTLRARAGVLRIVLELLKNMRLVGYGNALALVAHLDAGAAVNRRQADVNWLRIAEAQRAAQQVEHDLLDPELVPLARHRLGLQPDDAASCGRLLMQLGDHARQQGR